MTFNWKGGLAKLFSAGVIGIMIYQAVVYIHPLVQDSYINGGMCNVTMITWTTQYCSEPTWQYISIPQLSGYYVPDNIDDHTATYYTHISLDSSIPTWNEDYDYLETFLYDDESGDLLIPSFNCANATVYSTKALLASYFPQLTDVIDLNSSSVDNTYSDAIIYPNYYFTCWYQDTAAISRALLYHTHTNKIFVLPFVLALLFIFLGLFLIKEYDDEGPVKEFAQFILSLALFFFYVLHAAFYTIFFVILGQIILNITPPMDVDEAWKAGSIFFPLKKLYKYLKRVRDERQVEQDTPPPTRSTAARSTTPPPTRARSTTPPPTRSTTPPLTHPSSTSHQTVRFASEIRHLTKPPSYPSFETGTVIPNLTVVGLEGDEASNLGNLPPPPSYDDVIRNDQYL